MNGSYLYLLLVLFLTLISCQTRPVAPLPIIGNRDIVNGDTIYHTIKDFEFINQENEIITPETFKDKYYVVDFFFTFCPTICPIVKKQTLKIYNKFEDDPRLLLISHGLDTKRDNVPALKKYADALEVSAEKWHFVTGDKDLIYEMADNYFIAAAENPEAPGGFDHSGKLILVDKNRHIRSFCEGTDAKDVDRFIIDIQNLMNEK